MGSELIVAGGESVTEPARILDRLLRLRSGAWLSEPMLVPRHALSLAPYGKRLWACGGGIEANNVNPVLNCTSIGR